MASEQKIRFYDKITCYLLFGIAVVVCIMQMISPPQTLDSQLFYSIEDAHFLFIGYSDIDKIAYFQNEIADIGLLLLYSVIFYINLRKKFPNNRFIKILALVPGGLDLAENAIVMYSLKYGDNHPLFDWLGIITFLKWTAGAAVFFTIVNLFRTLRIGSNKAKLAA